MTAPERACAPDPRTMPQVRRATAMQVVAWAVLLAVVTGLSLRGWGTFQVGVYQDDAHYLLLARSLAFGDQYGLINAPGAPAPSKYPFAFPLLLAPVVRLFPHQPLAATGVGLAATLINVCLLFWGWPLLSPATSRWWGLGVASLYGVSPMVIGQTRQVMADPVFAMFVFAALLLAEAMLRGSPPRRWLSIPLGVALVMALFARSIGIALWAAVLLRVAGAQRRVGFAPLAGIVAGSLGALLLVLSFTSVEPRHLSLWTYVTEAQTGGPSPASATESVVDRALRVGGAYASTTLREVLVPVGAGVREQALAARIGLTHLPELLGAGLTLLIAVGTWQAWRAGALAASALLFQLIYVGGLLLWPWIDHRYVYPVQPLLAFELLWGTAAAGTALRRLWPALAAQAPRRVEVVALCAVLVGLSAWKSARVVDSRTLTRDLRVGATWLQQHSDAGAIIMARYPQSVYLYAERSTVGLKAVSGADLERDLDEQRVDYLLIGPKLEWREDGSLVNDERQLALQPVLEEMVARGRLTQVYESAPRDKVRIYRVERRGAGGDRQSPDAGS